MDKKKTGIPKLRFPGFTDPWEQHKLGDVVTRYDNLRIPVAASKRKHGTTPYYGANGIQDYIDGFTHDGEFLLVAEDGANDLKNYPVNYVNGKVWVNNHAHVIQAKSKLASNLFLSYSIKTINIQSYLVGGGRAKLNAEIMMNLPIMLPYLNEQVQIGEFINNVDKLITLHQRKLDHLKEQKTGLLQKMFPKNGETIPEVRFPGFTDAWEQHKLGDVVKFPHETVEPQKFENEIFSEYSMPAFDSGQKPYIIKGKRIKSLRIRISNNTLLVNKLNVRQRRIWLVKEALPNSVASSEFVPVVGKNYILEFIKYYLLSDNSMRKLESLSNGTSNSQKRITPKDLKNFIIYNPISSEEIKSLDIFLHNIEILITLHQRKLDHLKLLKKGLLQQMFV